MKKEKLNNMLAIPSKIEKLKRLFPEYFDKNGNFLIEKFTQDIYNQTDISKETYSLEWLGKSYSRVLAYEPPRTYIKEDINWNKNNFSKNALIKGDNLEVLKHLVNAYENEIKMIYIDPPYNTGNDGFVYQDNRKFTPIELSKLAGISIEKAEKILNFLDSKSNSHSAWLTFMYPRLYIARKLLKEDGVIFVSIDDNEVAQLKLLMDEIFGEENFVGMFSVEINPKGRKNSNYISISNDYCLVYAKFQDKGYFRKTVEKDNLLRDENGRSYSVGKRVLVGKSSNKVIKNYDSEKHYSVYFNPILKKLKIKKEEKTDEPDNSLIKEGYTRYISVNEKNDFIENTYTIEQFLELFENNALIFKENTIYEKEFNVYKRIKSILTNNDADVKTETATKQLTELFSQKDIFKAPKNVNLIKFFIDLIDSKDFFVLDFFAGSGTTGDAVMQLNAKDGGKRKFILVQLPEPIDPHKNKVAYDFVKNKLNISNPTIFEITKERLIRSAKKIKKDSDKNIDLSFKIYETIKLPEEYLKDMEELTDNSNLLPLNLDENAILTTWKLYDGIKLEKNPEIIDLGNYNAYKFEDKIYIIHANFVSNNLEKLIEKIDNDDKFKISKIVINGHNIQSIIQREIDENIKSFANKKSIEINVIVRY